MPVASDDAGMAGYSVPDLEKCRLLQAWRIAAYAVWLEETAWPLRIGERAGALEQRAPAGAYALISAWNPPPGMTPGANNHAQDRRLQARLREAGLIAHAAEAGDNHGDWREPGWLVLDAARPQADALAREFGQGGLLYWRRGDAVGLRLMWSRPPGAGDDPAVEWAGGS